MHISQHTCRYQSPYKEHRVKDIGKQNIQYQVHPKACTFLADKWKHNERFHLQNVPLEYRNKEYCEKHQKQNCQKLPQIRDKCYQYFHNYYFVKLYIPIYIHMMFFVFQYNIWKCNLHHNHIAVELP